MPVLSMAARRVLRDAGIPAREYIDSWSASGQWQGDTCGCPDDRCIGHHHDAEDDCGCLRTILDERKKNAPGAEQSAEGNDPTIKGEIMTTVTDRYPSLSIANYCATLRRKHSEVQPITNAKDPRLDMIVGTSDRLTRERATEGLGDPKWEHALGEIFFQSCVAPLVPIPITPPTWAHDSRVLAGDWPNIDIEFRSFPIEMGDVSAHWEQTIGITVDDDEAPVDSVPEIPGGTVHDDGAPLLVVTTPQRTLELEMSTDDMFDLAHVLRVAAGGMELDSSRSTV